MTTKIEWTDETWNPVTGCSKVSQGCKNCYAERLAPKVFAGQVVVPVDGKPTRPRAFTDIRCHYDRLGQPGHWKRPRRVFVNSMSDLFHEDVPDAFIDHVFAAMTMTPRHSFQCLTKRPQRMLAWATAARQSAVTAAMDFPDWLPHVRGQAFPRRPAAWPLPNVWLGVSVEDHATADERIPLLLQTPAAVRFVSYEPALGPVNFALLSGSCWTNSLTGCRMSLDGADLPKGHALDWIIAGGESGPNARPAHPDWFRSVRNQCAAAGVAFFFKQWGEWAPPIAEDDVPLGAVEGRMYRVGKKAAGRQLDGRTHEEYPA